MTDVTETPTVINSSIVGYNSSKNLTLNNMTYVTETPTVINSSNVENYSIVVYNSSKNSTLDDLSNNDDHVFTVVSNSLIVEELDKSGTEVMLNIPGNASSIVENICDSNSTLNSSVDNHSTLSSTLMNLYVSVSYLIHTSLLYAHYSGIFIFVCVFLEYVFNSSAPAKYRYNH